MSAIVAILSIRLVVTMGVDCALGPVGGLEKYPQPAERRAQSDLKIPEQPGLDPNHRIAMGMGIALLIAIALVLY